MSEIYIEHINKENVSLIQDFCTVKNEKDNDYFKSYLMYNGLLDSEQGMAKTKLYIEEDDNGHKKILGFYSIRCSSLIMDSGECSEKMGEPALEIVELAVHKDYRNQGIGTAMMKNIIATAYELKEEYLGLKHLVVCAKETAKTYYEKFKFAELPGYKQIPRNTDNQGCIGMSLSLKIKYI